MPKIYIILVSWNSAPDLPALFSSLSDLVRIDYDLNFVLVDNGSQDNSVTLIQGWLKDKPHIKFFQNQTNLGFSFGHNQGIKYAIEHGADYVTLLNCDTKVEPDFLVQALRTFQTDQSIGVVQSLLLYFNRPDYVQSYGNALHYLGFGFSIGDSESIKRFNRHKIKVVDYSSFSAVTIKKEVFEKIGFLDATYVSYHEDTDYCLRARLVGYKIVLQPQSVVYHNYTFPVGKNRDKNKLRYFWMEKNRFLILLKFYKLSTLLLIAPAFLFMEAGQILFSCLNGFFFTRLKVYCWLFKNFGLVCTLRKEVQNSRLFGDKYLLQNMTGVIEFQSVNNPLLRTIGNPVLNLYFKIIKKIVFW